MLFSLYRPTYRRIIRILGGRTFYKIDPEKGTETWIAVRVIPRQRGGVLTRAASWLADDWIEEV